MARSTPPDGDGALDARRPAILVLRVRALGRSLAFWHGCLGVPIRLRTPGRAELQTETVTVVLEEDVAAPISPGAAVLAWEVADLDAARRELERRGVTTSELPAGDPAAGARIRFADPDGHVLELVAFE